MGKDAGKVKFVPIDVEPIVRELCPWAKIVAKTTGGFMAFEKPEDYVAWYNDPKRRAAERWAKKR